MESKKPNRSRNILIRAFVDEDEMEHINHNMKRAGIKNKSDYIRQMCIFGKVVSYDDLYFRECLNELNRIGVNINQIAKVANRTDSIYAMDIQLLQKKYYSLSAAMEEIFLKIDTLIETAQNAKFETLTEQINKVVERLHEEKCL